MEGVKILDTINIDNSKKATNIVVGAYLLFFVLGAISVFCINILFTAICLALGIVCIIIEGKIENNSSMFKETRYVVVLDDNVDIEEFYNTYQIIDGVGIFYEVRKK